MLYRNALPGLRAALADTPVVLLHGARQTGKTTLTRAIAAEQPERRYLTLDDTTVLAAALANPAGLIAGLDGPVVIDEVQRAPGLFLAIKAEVDRKRTPGRYLLTGSANVLLVPKVSESLAGRVELITLWPLSQAEIEGRAEHFVDAAFGVNMPVLGAFATKKPEIDIIARIVRGGYPEPLTRPAGSRQSAWFASYLTTILQRDVRDLANIDGLADFPKLLGLIASRTSGLLNFSDLSRSLSMPQSTLKRYFALLEATFLVVTLPAWSNNQGLRLAKAPKVMLADTGLACHVLGTDAARLKVDGSARDALLENFIAMELNKQIGWSNTRPKLYHFRTTAGREVDLVLEDAAGRVVGIEIKASTSVNSGAFAGLRVLREAAGSKFVRGIVLHDGAETVPFEKDLAAVPLAAVWQQVAGRELAGFGESNPVPGESIPSPRRNR